MAFDADLADRIRELTATESGLDEKRMFGGLAFLINGNMAVAASREGGLMVRQGAAVEEIPALASALAVDAVFANHDDEPDALARDAQVRTALAAARRAFHTSKDHTIFERSEILTQGGTPYSVFTPYKNAWLRKVDAFYLSAYPVERYAQALAPRVRVNGVAPGLIYVSGPQSGENFRRASSVNLLQSATDPADVASSAVFLAENPSITGVTIAVDKGQHLVPLARDIMFVAEQLAPAASPGTA